MLKTNKQTNKIAWLSKNIVDWKVGKKKNIFELGLIQSKESWFGLHRIQCKIDWSVY